MVESLMPHDDEMRKILLLTRPGLFCLCIFNILDSVTPSFFTAVLQFYCIPEKEELAANLVIIDTFRLSPAVLSVVDISEKGSDVNGYPQKQSTYIVRPLRQIRL
jgi:hypothetical protein